MRVPSNHFECVLLYDAATSSANVKTIPVAADIRHHLVAMFVARAIADWRIATDAKPSVAIRRFRCNKFHGQMQMLG